MKNFLFILISVMIVSACMKKMAWDADQGSQDSQVRYVGEGSKEMFLEFDNKVMMEFHIRPPLFEANAHIEKQIVHLFGPFGEGTPKAVPKGNHRLTNIAIKEISTGPEKNLYEISYHYRGTIVLEKNAEDSVTVVLPVNPEKIYEAAMVGSHNPCTDHHYQSKGDFWYFWWPQREGCKLKEGIDYQSFKVTTTAVGNELPLSFPEYDRLVDAEGLVSISVLAGLDKPGKSWNPKRSTDINAFNVMAIQKKLLTDGFTSVKKWDQIEFDALIRKHGKNFSSTEFFKPKTKKYPHVEEFEKNFTGTNIKKIRVKVFFGASGIDENSKAFHYLFKDAVENDSIMIYAGHSGLGGHLDLPSIEQQEDFKFKFNQNKYQIFYFNSCTSYSYYNELYFAKKRSPIDPKGTKNLDIFSNGLATLFVVMDDSSLALINAVVDSATGKRTSYQELAKKIDSNNLFGVNGDEDNPIQ